MKFTTQTATIITAVAVFAGLPLIFYGLSEAPRRTLLKEIISIITFLAFAAMLGQFFMARSNAWLLSVFKPPQIQKVHKYIAYSAIAVMFLHPVLIVLPRAFEGGIKPWNAFVTMITTFNSLGILLGLFTWIVMALLFITVLYRRKLIPQFARKYRGWRYFHGGLAVTVTVTGLWHAIELGRHTDLAMSALFITLTLFGFAMLAQLYRGDKPKTPKPTPTGAVS